MLVSNHLTTTEQCQVAGGPFWDGAASFGRFSITANFSLRLHWPLATILSSLATISCRPPGPAGSGRAQTLPRWLLPATDCRIAKDRMGLIWPSGPSILIMHRARQFLWKIQSVPPTRRRPTVDHSLVAGGAQRQWLQACLPDGHQPQCPLLYVPSAHKHLSQKASAAVAAILEKKTIADASNRVYDQRCAKLSNFTPLLVSRDTKSPPGWPSSLPSRGRP